MYLSNLWAKLSGRLKFLAIVCGAITALFTAGGTIGAAWSAAGLPRPVLDHELSMTADELRTELRHQSVRIARSDIDSRGVQIDQDTLTKSRLLEKQDEYHQKGVPVPDWLHQQLNGVSKNIEYNIQQREKSTLEMEKAVK